MERRFNSLKAQVFDISTIMTSYGLTIPDVIEAEMQIKHRQTDVTPLVTKTLGGGVLLQADYVHNGVTIPFAMIVEFQFTDYGTGKLEAGESYFVGIGIKRTGDTCFIEGDLNDADGLPANTMRILQNTMSC